jgi:hypothetical protein
MKTQVQKSPSELVGEPRRRGEGDTLACLRRLYQQAGPRGEDISLTCTYTNGIESFSLSGKHRNVPACQGNNQRGVAPSKPPPSSQQPNRKERRAADPDVMQRAAAHTAKQAAHGAVERAAASAPAPILQPEMAGAPGLGAAPTAAEEAATKSQITEKVKPAAAEKPAATVKPVEAEPSSFKCKQCHSISEDRNNLKKYNLKKNPEVVNCEWCNFEEAQMCLKRPELVNSKSC